MEETKTPTDQGFRDQTVSLLLANQVTQFKGKLNWEIGEEIINQSEGSLNSLATKNECKTLVVVVVGGNAMH